VVQEGMIGLYNAVRDFDPTNGASFRAFADLCVTRQVLTAIKTATRLKHTLLNMSVSLDRPPDGEDSDRTVADIVPEPDSDPLDHVIENDSLRRLHRTVNEILSDLEADVLRLYVEGRSYEEIAESLGRRTKSIDNALQRIKRKVEHQLPVNARA
ncbi:MAG: sigma-70 family RNA polymerase sigma factor, partial [Nitriliruptorales bacterium]|nr:sigma-70 family RNA polymerase sigma factor [Nitriliruptorales bacterium]